MSFSLNLNETGRAGRFSHEKILNLQFSAEIVEDDCCCSTFFWCCTCTNVCFSDEDDVHDRRKSRAALMRARRKTEVRRDNRIEEWAERGKETSDM